LRVWGREVVEEAAGGLVVARRIVDEAEQLVDHAERVPPRRVVHARHAHARGGAHLVAEELERLAGEPRRHLRHARVPAGRHLHQADPLQPLQRLPHRHPRDAELGRDLGVAHPGAAGQLALEDRRAEPVVDGVGEALGGVRKRREAGGHGS